ncbi:MAG: bifunctional phosphopantothenoylcysteine decarboxylase/phosphopantothenate--cysteine ligase CoaBC [Hyphomicrobiales bacterium]|nr:bifunctional phosphopantothenoylcysteine decarboxylase/phosphopantothenate--cysteine ligase CoaBC [Hyphomicrobiales bacterium]
MATITVRNLDEQTKQAIRERAARNGHSMEEEARLLLGAGALADNPERVLTSIVNMAEPEATVENYAPGSQHYFPARGKTVLLIICGGIAAYKSLDLIRRLKERDVEVNVVMTRAAGEFITPLSAGALSHSKVFTDLFDRQDEHDIGHIRLAREADLIVVAPATANMIAKISHGFADDLASAILLASKNQILLAPAMNPAMWNNPATRRNVEALLKDGVQFIGPETGEMAERSEAGRGRMTEPMDIVGEIGRLLDDRPKPLAGLSVVLTAGPTHEPIDPVRYIANRSSGKQGYAIADALAAAGAEVNLVSGPVELARPAGINFFQVESARQMHQAVKNCLPVDIAVMVAAVADWRVANSADEKIKKKPGSTGPVPLKLTENPDILKFIGHHEQRPKLVIGFAAETRDVIKNAKAKLKRKGADWILANDVSPETGIMGGDSNTIKLLSSSGVDEWPNLAKDQVARRLVDKIIAYFDSEIISV